MHEVEVKAEVSDTAALIAKLKERGCELGPEVFQDDAIYVREVGSLDVFLGNDDFLRLRVEDNGRTLFTFKRHVGRASDPTSAPLEHELAVDSREEMEKILFLMGYREAVRVRKHRRKGRYENWEVCVDEVEGLGSFIELEELAETAEEAPLVQERMKAFFAELGIDVDTQVRNRYDILLLQKKYMNDEVP